MEVLPVLVAVIVSVLLVPVVTVPKSRLAPLNDRVPPTGCVIAALLELNPWQPTIVARQRTIIPTLLARLHVTAAVPSKHFIGLS